MWFKIEVAGVLQRKAEGDFYLDGDFPLVAEVKAYQGSWLHLLNKEGVTEETKYTRDTPV